MTWVAILGAESRSVTHRGWKTFLRNNANNMLTRLQCDVPQVRFADINAVGFIARHLRLLFAGFTLFLPFRYSATSNSEPSQVQQYVSGARFIFVPVVMLAGYCMYADLFFAIIGVALWLGAYRLSGFGAALLSQVALFIARKIWLVVHARRSA
jgi:hypothetical protein